MIRQLNAGINWRQCQGLAIAVGLVVTWVLAGWIVADATTDLILAALAFIVVGILVITVKNWRSGFYLSLVWLLFEDLARKYLGSNMYIYFGKDVLIGMTYLSFFLALRRRQAETFRPSFLFPLSLFFWLPRGIRLDHQLPNGGACSRTSA